MSSLPPGFRLGAERADGVATMIYPLSRGEYHERIQFN